MGKLLINRNRGQRVRLGVAEGHDPAELIRQLMTEGIWIEGEWVEARGQFRLVIEAPDGVQVLREELLANVR
ncbi:carbon storage regulator [Stutzerimonas degradans]|uniref:carbon storage regulator n=1 Tax=Stutzerimonas degradans TaxID=2968968 RepID=UPI00141DC687|nr:carbon storage regulator [Stutzerimonas degradans]NHW01910.1 carbon storage regulator [Stutzerimonas degradans]